MTRFAVITLGVAMSSLVSLTGSAPAQAATFVYVSNAEDGDIGTFTLKPDGELQPGARVKAASVVMPMAVSPDRRFLYAGVALQAVLGARVRHRPAPPAG